MYKTDVLTRTADNMRDATISPRVYSMDQVKQCFEVSQSGRSPIVVRIDAERYDLKAVADFAKILDRMFPDAKVSLMAENI